MNLLLSSMSVANSGEEDIGIILNVDTERLSEGHNAVLLRLYWRESKGVRAVLRSHCSHLAHLCGIKLCFCEIMPYLKLLNVTSTNEHVVSFPGIQLNRNLSLFHITELISEKLELFMVSFLSQCLFNSSLGNKRCL